MGVNEAEFSEIQEYVNQQILDRELSLRGVSIKKEVAGENVIEIPVLPQRPAVKAGEVDKFLYDTKVTLGELNILEDEKVQVRVRVINFSENLPEDVRGPDRSEEQELKVYDFLSPERVSKEGKKNGVPLVIFSHGGKIHPEVINSSGYLPMLYKDNPDMMLVAMDHRGSQSHKEKENYGLDDRVADVLITIKYARNKLLKEYEEKGIKWNGKVVIIGDSMGGEVASVVAGKIEIDGVVLTEPAAYSVFAHNVKFGGKFENEPIFGGEMGVIKTKKPDDSHAFDSIRDYVKKENSGVLMIKMKNDKIVGGVPNMYIYKVNKIDPNKIKVIEVEGGHGSTTADEVRSITEFVKKV